MQEYFDKETEQKLILLGKKKYAKTLILTALWIIGVLTAGITWTIMAEEPINSPSNFIYPLLCILPFYPFKAHKILFTKTFYGKVESAKYSSQYKTVTGRMTIHQMKELEVDTANVSFKGDHGESYAVTYKEASVLANDIYYKQRDRVLVIKGLKYPVKYPLPDDSEYICPVCGNYIKPGKRVCGWCKADFT